MVMFAIRNLWYQNSSEKNGCYHFYQYCGGHPPRWPPLSLPLGIHTLCSPFPPGVLCVTNRIQQKWQKTEASILGAYALSVSFSDHWLGETNDRAVRKRKQPKERPVWRGTDVSSQQPGKQVSMEADPSPVEPCSDCSLGWHLDCRLWETLGQRHPAKLLPHSWPTETELINAYFLKLLILG